MSSVEMMHAGMVQELVKNPEQNLKELTPNKVNMIHAAIGVAGEAGELLYAIKKIVIYNKNVNYDAYTNIVEELGDIEFYMEQIRQEFAISRNETLEANMKKLAKRYPNFNYSNEAAAARADKNEVIASSLESYKGY